MKEVKENTLVKRISSNGTELTARVRWVNEKGDAGITYLTPEVYAGGGEVVNVDELEVIREDTGVDLKDVPTKDLIAAITRLRGMRLPKKTTERKTYKRKAAKSKLDTLFETGGSELDALIAKAIQEIKEEGE